MCLGNFLLLISIEKFPKEKALKRSCGSIKNNEVNKKRSIQNITKECILGSIITIVSMFYYLIL